MKSIVNKIMEQNTEKTSLLDTLNEVTEHKPAVKTDSSFVWNFEDEEEDTTLKTEIKKEFTNKINETNQIIISDKEKEKNQQASAETLTSSLDLVFDLGGSLYLATRFKNNFTDEEWERVKELQDVEKEGLNEKDLILKTKFNRLDKKRKEKLKDLPFDDNATARLNRIYFNYFKTTGKELNPETMLYVGSLVAILEKAQTIFLD